MGSETHEYCGGDELAVIDFTDENMKPGSEAWVSACSVARCALEKHGCFIVVYDKVDSVLCDSVLCALNELFDLPLETKKQSTSEKLFHSYLGGVSWLPLYESLAIDNPLTQHGTQHFTNLMWPQGNEGFCETMKEYVKLVGELEGLAMRMVFESYGVEKERFDRLMESKDYLLRVIKYRKPKGDEGDVGLQTHSDLTLLSVLHQLNLSGLEIKPKNKDHWIGVQASQSSYVVMAGDALKVWSNGRVHACEHRVTMRNAEKTRYSTGLFSFSNKTDMEVEKEVVDEHNPLRYKPFDHYGYLRFFNTLNPKESAESRLAAYCGIQRTN